MWHRREFLRAGGAGLAALLPVQLAFRRQLQPLQQGDPLERERLLAEYMLDPSILYLNHGSMGTMPRAVHEAHKQYLELCERNPHFYIWEAGWTEAVKETRARAARFMKCSPEEIAFTHNTTESFNLLAQGLPLGPGDEVLFSSLNHLSASHAWRHYGARMGYTVRTFDIPLERVPELTQADLIELYDRHMTGATRVLVFPEVDNIVGLRHPVAALAARARERGVEFVAVDGAQVLGMLPIDVAGADFYAASPHKWLQAPKGLGLLYVRKEVQPRLSPMWVKHPREDLPPTAEVYEDYSTRNLPELVTLGHAIEFQNVLDADAKTRRYMELRRRFREGVGHARGLRWRSPERAELSCSLYAIEPEGDARAVLRRLQEDHRVILRAFGPPINTLRVSPNLVTSEVEVERFFTYLRG